MKTEIKKIGMRREGEGPVRPQWLKEKERNTGEIRVSIL